jgi:hypothetical protein
MKSNQVSEKIKNELEKIENKRITSHTYEPYLSWIEFLEDYLWDDFNEINPIRLDDFMINWSIDYNKRVEKYSSKIWELNFKVDNDYIEDDKIFFSLLFSENKVMWSRNNSYSYHRWYLSIIDSNWFNYVMSVGAFCDRLWLKYGKTGNMIDDINLVNSILESNWINVLCKEIFN